jgi:hypothetical protein
VAGNEVFHVAPRCQEHGQKVRRTGFWTVRCLRLIEVVSVSLFESPPEAKRGRGGLAIHARSGSTLRMAIPLHAGGVGLWNVMLLVARRNASGSQ